MIYTNIFDYKTDNYLINLISDKLPMKVTFYIHGFYDKDELYSLNTNAANFIIENDLLEPVKNSNNKFIIDQYYDICKYFDNIDNVLYLMLPLELDLYPSLKAEQILSEFPKMRMVIFEFRIFDVEVFVDNFKTKDIFFRDDILDLIQYYNHNLRSLCLKDKNLSDSLTLLIKDACDVIYNDEENDNINLIGLYNSTIKNATYKIINYLNNNQDNKYIREIIEEFYIEFCTLLHRSDVYNKSKSIDLTKMTSFTHSTAFGTTHLYKNIKYI